MLSIGRNTLPMNSGSTSNSSVIRCPLMFPIIATNRCFARTHFTTVSADFAIYWPNLFRLWGKSLRCSLEPKVFLSWNCGTSFEDEILADLKILNYRWSNLVRVPISKVRDKQFGQLLQTSSGRQILPLFFIRMIPLVDWPSPFSQVRIGDNQSKCMEPRPSKTKPIWHELENIS